MFKNWKYVTKKWAIIFSLCKNNVDSSVEKLKFFHIIVFVLLHLNLNTLNLFDFLVSNFSITH